MSFDERTPVSNALLRRVGLLLDKIRQPSEGYLGPLRNVAYAARHANLPMVMRLLERGSDVNSVGTANESTLRCAVRGDDLEIVQFVIERGCQVATADLHLAVLEGKDGIADCISKALRESEASDEIEAVRNTAMQIREEARKLTKAKRAKIIFDGLQRGEGLFGMVLANYDRLNDEKLHVTVAEVITEITKLGFRDYLNHVNPEDVEQRTFLCFALENRLDEIAEAMLRAGASPSPKENSLICKAQNITQLEMLLKFGATIQEQDNNALRRASREGDILMVERLLELGADPRGEYSAFQGVAEDGGYFKEEILDLLNSVMPKTSGSSKKKKSKSKGKTHKAEKKLQEEGISFRVDTVISKDQRMGVKLFLEKVEQLGNGEYQLVAVKAKAKEVATALAPIVEAEETHFDITRKALRVGSGALFGFSLKDSDWTIVPYGIGNRSYPSHRYAEQDLIHLTEKLNTRAVMIYEDDTVCIASCRIFESGQLVRRFFVDEDGELCHYDGAKNRISEDGSPWDGERIVLPIDEDDDLSFQAAERQIFEEFFRSEGIFVPLISFESDGYQIKLIVQGIEPESFVETFQIR